MEPFSAMLLFQFSSVHNNLQIDLIIGLMKMFIITVISSKLEMDIYTVARNSLHL